jgi:ADP-ribose pyrophosphatase YjhB (NUDIX family)
MWKSGALVPPPPSTIGSGFHRTLSALKKFKRVIFALLSRTCLAIYSRIPIFGYLRAAVAVIRGGDRVLVIARSDGRGYSFPGGLAWPWEDIARAVNREVLEETGLHVEKSSFLFEYRFEQRTHADVPCTIAVFQAEVSGEVKESWEGTPLWLPLSEIASSLLPSQKEIVARMLK